MERPASRAAAMIELFDPGALPESLIRRWPMEAAYIRQFADTPSSALIRNAATTVRALSTGDALMPITVDASRPGNCYVVSPAAAYTAYARFELQVLPQRWLRAGLNGLIAVLDKWLRRVRFDRTVHVNNWMLSTNLYGDWEGAGLADITAAMIESFPDKAIVFRSLNPLSNGRLLELLARAGYLFLPSRQIYVQDARHGNGHQFSKRRDSKQDSRLLARSGYRVSRPDSEQDSAVFDRLEYLYGQLYLDKYTRLNPQFTSQWLRNGCQDRWLNLFCLVSPEGRIDGVAGMIRRGATTTTPVLGYDIELPQSLGMYRMLSWICTDEAIRNCLTLNCSAGAAAFKRSRGAAPYIEYSAAYVRHLDVERKLAWQVLNGLLNRFAAPLLRRYAL